VRIVRLANFVAPCSGGLRTALHERDTNAPAGTAMAAPARPPAPAGRQVRELA
jgi:hypothetical protein